METPEQEAARVRSEVMDEIKAEESGEIPTVDAEKEIVPETKVEDPWKGVNPALKQVFDEMSSKVVNLQATETRLKQAETRIGSITNELHAAKKAAETVKAAPSADQIKDAAESDEKWNALKADFPDWADAFDGRFDKKLTSFDKKLTSKVAELKDEIMKEVAGGKVSDDLDARLLSIAKPDWKETLASVEWKEWLAQQPADVIALTASPRAEDAILCLTKFEKAERPTKTASEIAAERKERMKTAVIPQGRKAVPVKSEAEMTAAELRNNIGKEVYADT